MREDNDQYQKGGYYRVDDRTGLKVRARNTLKQWNGLIVDKEDYEERHPQEFMRAPRRQQPVDHPRPEPTAVFGGNLMTLVNAAALAGATTIEVESTARFGAGDTVSLGLDNLDMFRTTVSSVTDSTHLVLASALPFSAAVDMAVVNNTAVTASDIG